MSQANPLQDTLTIREAAALLGVHPNTVRNRINAGVYRAEKVITGSGPTYYIQRSSLTNNPATNSATSGLQKLPNRILETSPHDLQLLLSDVVKEATGNARAEEEARAKLTRAREGTIEALKLEHSTAEHIGTISLGAIAAFAALLGGVFSDPKVWESSAFVIPISPDFRQPIIFITFAAFLASALAARLVEAKIRETIEKVATAENFTELESLQRKQRTKGRQAGLERYILILSFGLGILSFLIFVGLSTPTPT